MGSSKAVQQKLKTENGLAPDKYFVAFSFLAEVSASFKKNLYEYFDFDIKRAWQCDKNDLREFEHTVPRAFFEERDKIEPEKVYEKVQKMGMRFITCEDAKYPKLLREIPDYPLLLYYEGDLEACNFNKALAVVGSRKASESAKCALSGIISEFQNTDVLIVSGLAYGIDATAHRAALDNNLKTVGTIASGLDFEYPSTNKELYRQIKQGGGVVISEFPPGSPPVSHHFPIRNRIVTGSSYGTLVAEAALKSGAMISANLTLEHNRELMCMPGAISNPNTAGIYKLLKDGAHLVTSASDVCDVMGWEILKDESAAKLSDIEKNVLEIIGRENSLLDKIQQECALDTQRLMVVLTTLELHGLIKQIRGQYFISR
ncbi:DNA processing protein [Candidatus Gastranaerophilus sp. (ex Termes propinquus)]|nr:DNA processing protein [Candidatus Gastranaerophilus sp. (ex Termes propinquus)]